MIPAPPPLSLVLPLFGLQFFIHLLHRRFYVTNAHPPLRQFCNDRLQHASDIPLMCRGVGNQFAQVLSQTLVPECRLFFDFIRHLKFDPCSNGNAVFPFVFEVQLFASISSFKIIECQTIHTNIHPNFFTNVSPHPPGHHPCAGGTPQPLCRPELVGGNTPSSCHCNLLSCSKI
jgi:hypothetical protein